MKYLLGGNKNTNHAPIGSKTEYLAIVSNDETGIFQVMSFETYDELEYFAEKCEDGLNHVEKYKAVKIR